MKKINLNPIILVLALITLVSCSSDDVVPIDNLYLNIPDSHFETILIDQGIDSDGIINQQMLRSDAEAISRLDLNLHSDFGDIEDLTGIEGFVNIEQLFAAGQKIEQIDLSYNTLLDSLNLLGNNITDIDLSNNSNLVFVDIQSNDLSTITGLSNLEKLKDLDLSWNYFEYFSIHNESLEILHFSHNDLKSLNTDGAVNLKHVFMPSNKLVTVDFSTNTLIETLLISGNNLENINLESNSNLTHLYITANGLTSLDVSHNLKLEDLRVFNNLDLSCIKVESGQEIPSVWKSDTQELNSICD